MLSLLQREKVRLRGFKQQLIGIGITNLCVCSGFIFCGLPNLGICGVLLLLPSSHQNSIICWVLIAPLCKALATRA